MHQARQRKKHRLLSSPTWFGVFYQTSQLSWVLLEEILHQLIGRFSRYLQGFIHPRWLAGFPSTVSGHFIINP